MDQLAIMSGYEEAVPDIITFINDPYYLGKSLGDGLYPIWFDAVKKVFPSPYYSQYGEIVLSGAIGQGKSTFALLVVLYDICKMLSLKSPHEYYNLIESTVISFALMNATKSLAGSVLYGQMIEWVEASPYFTSKLVRGKKRRTLFIKNIDVVIGSRGRDMLGQATAGAIFSEINDMTVVGDQAEDNFDTIATRRESRFGGKGKDIIGHLILDSSNKGSRSFIDVRMDEKRKKGVTDYILFAYTHWDAKWHLGHYSGKFFKVYGGDDKRDPFIIPDDLESAVVSRLDQSRIIDVPIEHHEQFHYNITKSLQDLAGVSTLGSFNYISSIESLKAAFTHLNPITKDVIVLDFFDDEQKISQFIDVKTLSIINNSARFIHVDLGLKNDSTGIACSFLSHWKDLSRFDEMTGNTVYNREPVFLTEWVMEIRPLPGQEVPIYKIKDFILEAKNMGYNITKVSTDGFQSSNLRQDLVLKQVDTALISVDRTKDPYDFLRNAILEGRISLPKSAKLFEEFKFLEDQGKKYDHGSSGTKDLTDAVAGSVWSCQQSINEEGTTADASLMEKSIDAMLSMNKPKDLQSYLNSMAKG